MFQKNFVQKIKTHVLCLIKVFRKSCHLRDNVEQYGTARQATDDNIIWRMHVSCWIAKATGTHSEYVILIAFPQQKWLRERASIYVVRILLYVRGMTYYTIWKNEVT
jgi:hypothetical protein